MFGGEGEGEVKGLRTKVCGLWSKVWYLRSKVEEFDVYGVIIALTARTAYGIRFYITCIGISHFAQGKATVVN